MTLINDIRIKDHYVHNLPENRTLLGYARKNRRAGNMAENALGRLIMTHNGTSIWKVSV